MRVPSSAPINDTSPPKTGIALAIMYEDMMHPPVQLSQTAQWVKELFVRCWDPLRSRMKIYLAGSCRNCQYALYIMSFLDAHMRYDGHSDQKTRQCQAITNLLHRHTSRSQSWRSYERSTKVVDDDANHDIGDRDRGLADDQRPGVLPWVTHF